MTNSKRSPKSGKRSQASKRSSYYEVQDLYYKKAKAEGFVARSAFKLQELDDKYKLFKKGAHVLDLGCAPGSWLQYASQKVGPKGGVWGIDLEPVRVELKNSKVIVADIFELHAGHDFISEGTPFDVIQSDAMPKTSGIYDADSARSLLLAEKALALINEGALKVGGHFVCKIFEGPGFHELLQNLKKTFTKCHITKPDAVRKSSRENYIVALGAKDHGALQKLKIAAT